MLWSKLHTKLFRRFFFSPGTLRELKSAHMIVINYDQYILKACIIFEKVGVPVITRNFATCIGFLFVCLFGVLLSTFHFRIFHSYGDVTITSEGL